MSWLSRGHKWLLAVPMLLFVALFNPVTDHDRKDHSGVRPEVADSELIRAASSDRGLLQSPLQVVEAYFAVLSETGYTTYFGSIGDKEDYLGAYRLLSCRYQAELSFDRFHESFRGVASVELLRLILVPGAEEGYRQAFVELKAIEEVGPGSPRANRRRSAFIYYTGLVTVVKEGDAWKIDRVELEPEDFISTLGGHQPWKRNPIEVAAIAAEEALEEMGITIPCESEVPSCSVEDLGDGLTRISFSSEKGTVTILLVQPINGEWLPLKAELEMGARAE